MRKLFRKIFRKVAPKKYAAWVIKNYNPFKDPEVQRAMSISMILREYSKELEEA